VKIDAVLFDLDNTLILFDERKFFENYSIELSRELAKNTKLEMPEPDFKGKLNKLVHVLEKQNHFDN